MNTFLFTPPDQDSIALGATLIIDDQSAFNDSPPRYPDVLANEPEPPQLIIHYTMTMPPFLRLLHERGVDPSATQKNSATVICRNEDHRSFERS
jgi:hypothetical protein